jgi:hypothetical protein
MTAARDRISSTLFLAALLHGIVILGVTFGTGGIDFEPATSLDVVLVLDTQTAEQAPVLPVAPMPPVRSARVNGRPSGLAQCSKPPW